MVNHDKTDITNLVQHYRIETAGYWKQWALWLGVGCAGVAIALISLAASLPEPNFAFHLFVPSLWAFSIGVASAAGSLPFAALCSKETGEHFAEAFNREQLQSAVGTMPEVFSSPQRIADEMNVKRDSFIERGNRAHDRAERAWRRRVWWRVVVIMLLSISASCFVFGVAWPLIHISSGGSLTSAMTIVQP